jgi:hypothetical protein
MGEIPWDSRERYNYKQPNKQDNACKGSDCIGLYHEIQMRSERFGRIEHNEEKNH